MIQFNTLQIDRVIMHRILEKSMTEPMRQHVEVDPINRLVNLTDNIKELIRKRLMESCGRQGKAFELQIEKDEVGSCFDYVKDMHGMADNAFIQTSEDVATLLANAQDQKGSIPGGYFLLVDAHTMHNNTVHPVYIIMKAEKQEALSAVNNGVEALKNVFLSPAQKMYKVGIFEQISFAQPLTKDCFTAYLFDSQFNDGTALAEYFYKDFLGLTINGNSQVQTKMFYDKFCAVVDSEYKEQPELRNQCRDLLRAEMNNQQGNVNPREVINTIVPQNKRDVFISKVGNKYPNNFVKDTTLIKTKIDNQSYFVTKAIRLSAPTALFSNEVITITTDPENPTVKIIKIKTNGQGENAERGAGEE